jgi:hypothetical protein
MSARARPRTLFPSRFAMPYSVTTYCTSPLVVTTPAPGESVASILDTVPPLAVDGRARIDLPPSLRFAPLTKSGWEPMPLMNWVPIVSAHTWPVRSISMALFMEIIL